MLSLVAIILLAYLELENMLHLRGITYWNWPQNVVRIKRCVKRCISRPQRTIYGGDASDSLDKLRYRPPCDKMVDNTASVQVKLYPQLRLQQSSIRSVYSISCKYGFTAGLFVPQNGDGRSQIVWWSPSWLKGQQLPKISCKWQDTTVKQMAAARCTCRIYGLDCWTACRKWCGTACASSSPEEENADLDE